MGAPILWTPGKNAFCRKNHVRKIPLFGGGVWGGGGSADFIFMGARIFLSLGRGEAFGCPPAVCPPKRPRPLARYRFLVARQAAE